MPRYKSRRKSTKERERKRVRAGMPRDKRRLMHWAVRGTHDDFARFRKHVNKIADRAPSYISQDAMSALKGTDRRQMLRSGRSPSGGPGSPTGSPGRSTRSPTTRSGTGQRASGRPRSSPSAGTRSTRRTSSTPAS